MNKKIIFLLLCLITILSISTVSAIDNVTEENVDSAVTIGDTSYVVSDNSAGNENTNLKEIQKQTNSNKTNEANFNSNNVTNDFIDDVNKTNINSQYELYEALKKGGLIKFTDDITVYTHIKGDGLIVNQDNTIIDGDNHFITSNGKYITLKVTANNVTIKNLNVINCAFNNRAAITWEGNDGKVINCFFKNNDGCYYGSALNSNTKSIKNLLIVNSTFINNTGTQGGAVCLSGDNITISNSKFINNNGTTLGGGIYYWGTENSKIINCMFINGFSSKYGGSGAVHIQGSNNTIDYSVFINNTGGDGGAVGITYSNNSIINSIFINNSANYDGKTEHGIIREFSGGAIYFSSSDGQLIFNCTFSNNKAHSKGGAIYSGGNNAIILNSTFENNTVWDYGGAVFWDGKNGTINNSIFINNSACMGAGVSWNGTNGKILNSNFTTNHGGVSAGAIYWESDDGYVSNLNIFNNTDCSDTGIYWDGNNGCINNTIFNENWYAMELNGDNIKVNNTFFYKSYAPLGINGKNIIITNSNLKLTVTNATTVYGNVCKLIATLSDIDDNYIGNAKIIFSVDGENYTNITNYEGKALINLNLNSGNYSIHTIFCDLVVNSTAIVKPTIIASDLVKVYQNDTPFYAKFLDMNNNVLKETTVQFKINGVIYKRITDENGITRFGVMLKSGNYILTVINPITNEQKDFNVIINPTIEANDLVKMYKNDTQFYAKFLDSNGKILANTKVQFNINGVFYHKTTDENGVAKMGIQLRPGHYILTAINPVNGEQRGFNIIVKSLIESNDLTKYYLNESRFQATIYSKDGSLATNKEVTFNINGVFYHKTTDENGVASLGINLRPGSYIITTIVDGLEIGKYVTVLPTVLTNDLDMKFQDGSKFRATILNGQGIPLFNQNVTFNVNGVFYNKITDGDGIASLTINLLQGKYIITTIWDEYQVGNNITIS